MKSGRRSSHGPQGRPRTSEPHEAEREVRLNRYIAQSGLCSRRKADELISEGLVSVNGIVVDQLGSRVSPSDQVVVNGRLISPSPHSYILLNKPRDTITTTDDERGRKTVLDLINLAPRDVSGLYPVGRLDRNTTGVLLITNDGDLANRLMHPRFEVEKLYRVTTDKPVTEQDVARLRTGVDLDDGPARADRVMHADPADLRVVGISIHEGRNRQVRRMFEYLGYDVVLLDRVSYAGLTTDGLRRGKWRHLAQHEIRRLYQTVRLKTKSGFARK